MSNFVPQIIDFIVFATSLNKWSVDGFAIDLSHHNAAFTFKQCLYGLVPENAGKHPVVACRGASSLDMSECCNPCFIIGQLLFYKGRYFMSIALCMTLGNYDNA